MERKLEVITTYNKKYYDICGKKMIETFIKYWPKDVHLYDTIKNKSQKYLQTMYTMLICMNKIHN